MKIRILALLLCFGLLLTGCGKKDKNEGYQNPEEQGTTADLGDDNKRFGESLDDLGAYDGYFDGESTDIVVECVSGTQGLEWRCIRYEAEKTPHYRCLFHVTVFIQS